MSSPQDNIGRMAALAVASFLAGGAVVFSLQSFLFSRPMSEGGDPRLRDLQPISASGAPVVYLYNRQAGSVWIVTSGGIHPVPFYPTSTVGGGPVVQP